MEVCRGLYTVSASGYSTVGQHLGWIEFRRELPLNPAVVECPVVGKTPTTRWKSGLICAITVAIK